MSFNQLIIKQTEAITHQFSATDFDISRWHSTDGSVALTGGRGASQKIVIDGQSYVLRHYLRGGLIARFLHDLYIWTGFTQSRPFQEQKVSQLALKHDLPVPEVVAFRVQKHGLFYRASIISRFISNEGTLASTLYDRDIPGNLWFELGGLIKRLHQANIFHADLNANNILLDDRGKFTIIDFDKAKIISPLGNLAEKNIQRLLRSLKKIEESRCQQNQPFHFNMTQWEQLLAGYK